MTYSAGMVAVGSNSLSFLTQAVACFNADLLMKFRTGPGTALLSLISQA
jgi:hypothetical protein